MLCPALWGKPTTTDEASAALGGIPFSKYIFLFSHLVVATLLRELEGESFHKRLALYEPPAASPSREPASPGTAAATQEREALVGNLGLLWPAVADGVEKLIDHPPKVGFENVFRGTTDAIRRQQDLEETQP